MDAIDNLIYSTLNQCLYPSPTATTFTSDRITSLYQDIGLSEPAGAPPLTGGSFPSNFNSANHITSYHDATREAFVTLDDSDIIGDALEKHWFDIANRVSFLTAGGGAVDDTGFNFPIFDPSNNPAQVQSFIKFNTPPYHLIFSYLVENTRIAQIFEKLIWMYLHDEKLTKTDQSRAFTWIMNTEVLFYKDSTISDQKNIVSQLRPVSEATRRNAYQRMFGMDLAFGDINNNSYQYMKADFANSAFISMFENFLIEFWQGYINANNTSGQNTTDPEHLEDLARKLQEMLMSRRTTELNFKNYRYFNLSKEEYASYMFMFWLFYVISYDSPIVTFLNCTANTPGDRLINIGKKVGIPAHSKSVPILDIAQPMNATLRSIELGLFNNANFIGRVIRSQATVNPISPPATVQEIEILNNALLIINNWEKATGHRIKNPEAKLNATLKLDQKYKAPVLVNN